MSSPDNHSPVTALILSRDAGAYLELVEARNIPGVRWLSATGLDDMPGSADAALITLALGEPDLLAAAIPGLPALQWVQSTWAGVKPLISAAAGGLQVTGVKEVFGQQMAEYVLAYTLSHYLQLPARARAQQRGEWMAQPTESLAGKCVGIMGTGSIGAAIAQRLAGLDARVLGFSRSGAPQDDFAQVFGPSGLPGFLASLDVLVAVLPDTPETAGLLNAETLRYLPQEALLINVGRGSLIVEQDLVDVMQAGHLAGAVLDVFQTEPLPLDHPFWRTPRLSLTAHVAARSWPRDIAAIFCDNLERYLAGRPLRHTLDPTRGY